MSFLSTHFTCLAAEKVMRLQKRVSRKGDERPKQISNLAPRSTSSTKDVGENLRGGQPSIADQKVERAEALDLLPRNKETYEAWGKDKYRKVKRGRFSGAAISKCRCGLQHGLHKKFTSQGHYQIKHVAKSQGYRPSGRTGRAGARALAGSF